MAGLACAAACCASGENATGAGSGDRWLLSQWHRRVWQIEDGLPHNYVTAVSRDSDRYLLVGTQTGMARFDGMRFTPFAGLADTWVYSLLRTSDGSLWVGSYLGGLYRIHDGHTESWGPSKGFAAASVYSMFEERSHRIWLASSNGLEYIDGDRVNLAISGENTNGYGWQSITQDDAGQVWFAASRGLFRYGAGHSEAIRLLNVRGLPVTTYYRHSKNQLYLGTTAGLYSLTCGAQSCTGVPVADVKGPVVNIRGVSDGSLWAGTWGQGLYRLTTMRTEKLSSRDGLPDDFVRTVSEDSEGNVWVGTRGGGLTRFRAAVLKPVGMPEGLGGNCASVAMGDGKDGVWLATWRSGLFHWRDGAMRNQPLPQPSLGVLISALALDAGGNLWIGSFHDLWVLPHDRNKVEEVRAPGTGAAVTTILTAHDGSLWLAREGLGIFIFPSGDPRTSLPKHILAGESVTALMQDKEGAIWIGAERGLWRTVGSADPQLHSISTSHITALTQDSRGRIWVASAGRGISLYEGRIAKSMQLANLPQADVYSILDDGRGSIWFSTGRGLARGRSQDVDQFLASGNGLVNVTGYGIAEGMRTVECRCAKQPKSWKMPDGTLWIPTAKGFIEIDPSRNETLKPPRPLIEEVVLDGRPTAVRNTIRISPGDHELEARFTAVRLGPAEGVRFRYRLDGFESNWIESGSQRLAHYSHLPPGKFRLLVSARDAAGPWSDPAEIPVEQRPQVYQTLWLRLSVFVFLAASILFAFWLRLRGVRARYKSILEERNRIAREWHDTLLAGISAASWQLDAGLQLCSDPSVTNSLKTARGMLRYCNDQARKAIGDLRDEPSKEPRLPEAIRAVLQELTVGTAVHAQLDVDEKLPRLPSDFGTDLVRICQEATSNAMRHGRASMVSVRLGFGAGNLSLSVEDNGVGSVPENLRTPPPGHFGVLGMRERAHKLGGTLELLSEPGKGTLVSAVVPLPR